MTLSHSAIERLVECACCAWQFVIQKLFVVAHFAAFGLAIGPCAASYLTQTWLSWSFIWLGFFIYLFYWFVLWQIRIHLKCGSLLIVHSTANFVGSMEPCRYFVFVLCTLWEYQVYDIFAVRCSTIVFPFPLGCTDVVISICTTYVWYLVLY